MILMLLNVGSLMDMETSIPVSSLAGFPVEQTEDISVLLAEGSGPSVVEGFGILDILAGSWKCLVVRY